MNNARQSGMGLGMGRGSRRFYEAEGEEGKEAKADKAEKKEAKPKRTKKQIMEAIEYWKKQLKAGNYID